MKNKFSLYVLSAFVLAQTLLVSCVDKEYDAPETANVDPGLAISKTIEELQDLANGTTPTEITTTEVIAGIVIADDASGNFYKEVIIQDATGGISIPLDLSEINTNYPIGRRVYVKCKGLFIADDGDGNFELGVKNGTTIGRIPGALANHYLVPGRWDIPVEPLQIGLSDLLSNPIPTLTLIQLNLVQFNAADTSQQYADPIGQMSLNRTVEDCAGNFVTLYTSGFSDFAGQLTPSKKGSLVAVYKQYSGDPELIIRNAQDVVMTDPRCGSGPGPGIEDTLTAMNETFDGVTINGDVNLTGWRNIAVQGNRNWIGKSFSGNFYVQNSAYNSGLPAMESWLITPALDLSVADTLAFQSAQAFFVSNQLSVYISTDFDGTNVTSATWTPLTCTLASSGDANYTFVNSGDVSLTGFSGIGRIGFKYIGDGTVNTTTFQIDNVEVH